MNEQEYKLLKLLKEKKVNIDLVMRCFNMAPSISKAVRRYNEKVIFKTKHLTIEEFRTIIKWIIEH